MSPLEKDVLKLVANSLIINAQDDGFLLSGLRLSKMLSNLIWEFVQMN